jgi:8-oxo-dGTP pyrophosphatase MutT (NUDIX family)
MAHGTPITVADVEASCRSLPFPAWHRVVADHPAPKPAATLVPVVDQHGQAAVVVTRRAGTLSHGGDWVFPGGMLDADDDSSADGARREAAEELGIAVEHIRIVGQLDRFGPIVTGHVIDTYVGVIDGHPQFAPDPGEVADIDVVLIDDLLHPGRTRRAPMADVARGRRLAAKLPRFEPDLGDLLHYEIRPGHELWGLQANILRTLLAHLTGGAHQP